MESDADKLDRAINLLEELLSITEKFKNQLNSVDRDRWSEISALTADLREGEGNPCNVCENTTTPQHTSGECGHCHGIDKIVVYWNNGTEDRFDTLTEAKEVILNAHAEGLAVDSIEGQDSEGETLCAYEITWDIQIDQQEPEVALTPAQLEWLQKQQTGEK